ASTCLGHAKIPRARTRVLVPKPRSRSPRVDQIQQIVHVAGLNRFEICWRTQMHPSRSPGMQKGIVEPFFLQLVALPPPLIRFPTHPPWLRREIVPFINAAQLSAD